MRLLILIGALVMSAGCSTVSGKAITKSDEPNRKLANTPGPDAVLCYKVTGLRTGRHANEGTLSYQQDNDATGWVSLPTQNGSEFEKNYIELVKSAYQTHKTLCTSYKKDSDGGSLLDSVSVE